MSAPRKEHDDVVTRLEDLGLLRPLKKALGHRSHGEDVYRALGLLQFVDEAIDGEREYRFTLLMSGIEVLPADGDGSAIDFMAMLESSDPPIRTMHRLGRDFASKLEFPWTGADEIPEDLLSQSELMEIALERLARAGLVQFQYAFDLEGRPLWQVTEFFQAIEKAAERGDRAANSWLNSANVVDSPDAQPEILFRGRALARHFGVPWNGLDLHGQPTSREDQP
jgi:hypothetical protein